MKRTTRALALLLSLGTALFLQSGCMVIAGEHQDNPTNATLGSELIDLEEAFNAGLLTEVEYNKQRAKLLDRD